MVLGLMLGDSPYMNLQKCIFGMCDKIPPRQRFGALKGFSKDLAKFLGSGLGPRDPLDRVPPRGRFWGF